MPVQKTKSKSSFYVAAIGASAGGLEAMQKLLFHLPLEIKNIAFVITQHLSPVHKSMLAETLSTKTRLKVIEVKTPVIVKEKNIYITPPGSEIIIKKGRLVLSKPPRISAARPSIDNFFVSLARDQRTRAIGIILSGTGSDGAEGIKAIREYGGITLVQDPASAKYNSMPLAAINTEKVDYIMTAEKIASQLFELCKAGQKTPLKANTEAKRNGLEEIIDFLAVKSGTDFTNYKHNTLARRIAKRMTQLNISGPAQYRDYLEKSPREVDELFHTVLIGFTGFFRDPDVFRDLNKILLSIINTKPAHDPIRIWIVGCATGEEAYSVAISLAILQNAKKIQHQVQIIATDINEQSLNIARKGVYAKKAVEKVSPDILKNYFTPQNGNYEISKSIRSMVLFSRHDLTNNPPFLKLDLLVCRNLLIYYNSKLQHHVFPVFHSALLPNGYLLLGKSESVGHFTNLFALVNRATKIYQRKAAPYMAKVHYAAFRGLQKPVPAPKPERTIPEMVKETLFQVFEWPYVVVNDSMEIQEIHGEVNNYLGLKPGQMNANLIKLAHKDLKIELRSLVNKCITDKKEVKGSLRKITEDGKALFIKITVLPLLFSQQPDDYYLVIFESQKKIEQDVKHQFIPSSKNDARRIAELEKELEMVKEDLQTYLDRLENTNADQQSTNEELQAANEELKISNEELETTNEELQSANEEINIAYTELKAANDMLEQRDAALRRSEANVNALLSNTIQAFILLDSSNVVLAFNNVAHTTFKNIFGREIEIGDSFTHLIPEHLFNQFSEELHEALNGKQVVKEKEIKTSRGKSYGFILSCTPVLDKSHKVQALSFGMLDITELKKTKDELFKSQELLNSFFHTADIGIAVLDEKYKYIKTNDGYNKLFGYNNKELEGKQFTATVPVGMKKEQIKRLNEIVAGRPADEERTGVKKNGDYLTIYSTAKLLISADGARYLVLTARDISEVKKYQNLLLNAEKIAHIGGWEFDVVTEKLTCTDELYTLIEVDKKEFIKKSLEKKPEIFLDADTLTSLRRLVHEALSNGSSFQIEIPITTGTNARKWITVSGTADRLKSKTIRLSGTVQDITSKKEAEIQLERLSLVASKTNNMVIITDELGKTIWVNESFVKLTGFGLAEIMGKSPGAVLQGTDTDKATVRRISQQLKKGLPVSEVIKNYKKDGTAFWVNMDIAPVLKNKIPVNYIGVGVDVTELIRAREVEKIKERLEHQQELFNKIAKNFPDGIIGVLDEQFHYIFAGGSEIKKLGLTRDHFIGNKIFDHLSAKSNDAAIPFLRKAMRGENVTFEAEMLNNIYAVNVVPLLSDSNPVKNILIVLYNITKRKLAESDLRESLRKEQELGELKSRFVSMASHEFRTPLSTILSSTYLVEKYKSSDEQDKRERHLHRIITSVNMLTDILNDFLSVGKIEEGKIVTRFTEFNIQELVKATIGEMKSSFKKQQKIYYEHTGTALVVLDATLLKHIVMNLISNASKFSPETSPIEIKTVLHQHQMTLSVKDHGIGISKDDQQHLAERFFRGANAINIQGTGLGLHIVSKYAELMKGQVECKSELEKGTEFLVTLPTKTS